MSTENHKRIARNSIALYVRMLFSVVVSLYTSRVVLNALGVVDFGVYGVIGGIVSMLGFINVAMATGTQRFLNFEMGQGNQQRLRNVFSASMNIHFAIAAIVIVLAETLGLWFLNTQLNIPADRMLAANWVYQFTIAASVISILLVPYYAAIMARERMTAYAYIGVAEVFLKLIAAIVLVWVAADKLALYGGLIFVSSALVGVITFTYCRRFAECRYLHIRDRKLTKEISSFSGWSLFGTLANTFSNQGVNILINIFFSPIENAARAIAFQIQNTVLNMVTGFMTAVKPQIVKSYSQGDLRQMYVLIYSSSKFSFFLLSLAGLPIIFETRTLLTWWLKEVPDFTVIFTQLTLINLIVFTLFEPIVGASQASGKVKLYQIVVGVQYFANFGLTYLLYKIGMPVYSTFVLMIGLTFVGLVARLWVLNRVMQFPVSEYIRRVLIPIFCVAVISLPAPWIVVWLMQDGVARFLVVGVVSVVSLSCAFWFAGLTRNEKEFAVESLLKPIWNKFR